jgi:hypothetical protein
MLTLPNEHDLIALFESTPSLAAPGTPWEYNSLQFELTRGSDQVLCKIEPDSGEFNVLWHQHGELRAKLNLTELTDLSVHLSQNDEVLIASSTITQPKLLVKLRLKPFVSVELSHLKE